MKFKPFGVNQQIYQGSGSISMIPEICNFEGWKRIMIMADPGVEKFGAVKPFEELLKKAGLEYCMCHRFIDLAQVNYMRD